MKFFYSIKKEPVAWALTFFCTFCVGIFPLFYKKLCIASDNNILLVIIVLFLFSFMMSFLAGIPKLFSLCKTPKIIKKLQKKVIILLVFLSILTISGNVFFLLAIQDISPGIAQLIQRTEVIFVLYLSWMFFSERISIGLTFAAAFILVGMYFLKTQGAGLSIFQSFLPVFWATISGFCFALMQVLLQIIVKKNDPILINMFRLLVTLIIILCYPDSWGLLSKITQDVFFWGLLSALLGPFLARISYTYACRKIPVSTIVLITPIAPIFTIIFQWLFLSITIAPSELLGFVIILCSIYVAIRLR